MPDTVLILGARGQFGQASGHAFAQAGWRVLGQVRQPGARLPAGVQALPLNLGSPELRQAAQGARVVVHAVNVPYARWAREALPLLAQSQALAAQFKARLVLPGNVYNYGLPLSLHLTEGDAQQPHTHKGRLRVQMEERLGQAAANGQPSLVLRAGDFFGGSGGGWFEQVLVKGLERGRFVYPGPLHTPHAWAYLPDLARTLVALCSRTDLPAFARFHFPGHTLTGEQLCAAMAAAMGQPDLRARPLPWAWMRLAAPFVPMVRELMEMRYLWNEPHALSGAHLAATLGTVPHTPLTQALAACLPQR